jgi:hypothetical protein
MRAALSAPRAKSRAAPLAIHAERTQILVAVSPTGAQGVGLVDKKAFAKMMQASTDTIKKFELKDDIQVRQLQDDVAVIAYNVREDLIVDGKPVTFEAADSSTWVRRDGKWLCALHTEAISGDPYGRDRMKQ